ncbi:hypothetical protein BpHYR1_007619, partial [Brachionus plicatilis]
MNSKTITQVSSLIYLGLPIGDQYSVNDYVEEKMKKNQNLMLNQLSFDHWIMIMNFNFKNLTWLYLTKKSKAVSHQAFKKLIAPTTSAPKSTAKSASIKIRPNRTNRTRRTISAVSGEPGKTNQAYKPYPRSAPYKANRTKRTGQGVIAVPWQ